MQNRQLQDMRTEVAWLADLPTPSASTFITTSDLTLQVNKGYYEMFRTVVEAAGDTAYRTSTTFTTQSNVSEYDMPANVYEVKSVEAILNTTDRVLLERFTNAERPYLASATPGWNGEPFKYCVHGKTGESLSNYQRIEFLPVPAASLQIQVFFIFCPVTMVNGTDVVDGFAGFDDFAVLFAAHRCALKAENFELAASLAAERDRVRQQILEQLRSMDAFTPPRIQMTRQPWRPRYARRRW